MYDKILVVELFPHVIEEQKHFAVQIFDENRYLLKEQMIKLKLHKKPKKNLIKL